MGKIGLMIFAGALLIIVSSPSAFACRLDFLVTDADGNSTSALLTLTNVKTGKIRKISVPADGAEDSSLDVPNGRYSITAVKRGFKKATRQFSANCSESVEYLSVSIELPKGSSRQIAQNAVQIKRSNEGQSARRDEVYTIIGRRDDSASEQLAAGDAPAPEAGSQPLIRNSSSGDAAPTVPAGVVNGRAGNLVKPEYPPAAKAVRAAGAVNVRVTIDETGVVVSAAAESGHPLLRAAAVKAARASTFSPTLLSGQPVKVTGIIVYNFVAP